MEWGAQQSTALDRVSQWMKRKDTPYFYLAGWAGTGKSTLAKHIAESAGGQVLFGAYTGKAALIMQQKGCPGASTLHSLIYRPSPPSTGALKEYELSLKELRTELFAEGKGLAEVNRHPRVLHLQEQIAKERERTNQPYFTRNDESDLRFADLLIVDEVSMVDTRMGEDLLSFRVPILVLGDPGQLPPVRGVGFFSQNEPHYTLTEVHRQAKDNPIVRLATEVRHKKLPKHGRYGDSEVVSFAELKTRAEDVKNMPICLTGRNATRRQSNKRIRELNGRDSEYPVEGDQIVCLKNDHELGLLNGGLWNVIGESYDASDDNTRHLHIENIEDKRTMDVNAIARLFTGTDPKEIDFFANRGRAWFDFGNALTVHKSQGSQWTHGVIIDESDAFRQFRWNHLYTGLTRFSDRVLLATKG